MKVTIPEKEVNRLCMVAMKKYRTTLRKMIPYIKKTTAKKKAIKKERMLDYTIGRMVFFNENFDEAAMKAKFKNMSVSLLKESLKVSSIRQSKNI
jgi:hypothetical protein